MSLTNSEYGKDKIRLFRIVRQHDRHQVVEYNLSLLVQGNIQQSYTHADNSLIVATDSMKNLTYYLAKISPHILSPERFALHIASHVLAKYPHLHTALVTLEQLRWSPIPTTTHPHSFLRDGDDKRFAKVRLRAGTPPTATVTSGLTGLLVLKSTGSSFAHFLRDEYTTLPDVDDRIFSTAIDLAYTFPPAPLPAPADPRMLDLPVPPRPAEGGLWDADAVARRVRDTTLAVFAADDSPSVQATLFNIARRVLAENPGVASVDCALPNKHYLPVDMRYLGVDNLSPASAEVFVPVAAPSGLITATVAREQGPST